MLETSSIHWQGISLIIAGVAIAVVCSRLVRVWMDILEAKKMQKQENLQPLLGVVSPNFDKIVQMAKEEEEKKDVTKRKRK
jgi:orotate phosphoribosyltransferase-like protein